MKKNKLDFHLLTVFFIVHLLLFITYRNQDVFWYMFTGSMLLLISFSILKEELDDTIPFFLYLFYGTISGTLLFALFKLGFYLLCYLNIPIQRDISKLYEIFSPTLLWHYLSLILIAVPGEEIFWRGYIQKRLYNYFGYWGSIFTASLMYASVCIYSGEWILVLAAFISGLVWGFLFTWKKSIPLIIVSHLVFDLFLFWVFPF